jgi:hypothetical protein
VLDPDGRPVPGAKVTLVRAASGVEDSSTITTATGDFFFSALQPTLYTLNVEASNFRGYSQANIKVDAAAETSLAAIKLEIGRVEAKVEVQAALQTLQTGNAEVTSTLRSKEIQGLPLFERDPLRLLVTQAGVSSNGRGDRVVNGQRVALSNVTLDSINVQESFLRGRALDVSTNRVRIDSVNEFTLVTSNPSLIYGVGSIQVATNTPTDLGQFRGSLYWNHLNNATAAQGWYDNWQGLPSRNLRNQAGATVSGPIIKNKLFYFANYEGLLRRNRQGRRTLVPTDTYKNGVLFLEDAAGVRRSINIAQITGKAADPVVAGVLASLPGSAQINDFRVGDSVRGQLNNFGGYAFQQREDQDIHLGLGKLDFVANRKNTFTFAYSVMNDRQDIPFLSTAAYATPNVYTSSRTNLISGSWRYNPTATLTNEFRVGMNMPRIDFINTSRERYNFTLFNTYPLDFLSGLVPDSSRGPENVAPANEGNCSSQLTNQRAFFSADSSNPFGGCNPQGRRERVFNLQNNASYLKGRHTFQFGVAVQRFGIEARREDDVLPSYRIRFNDTDYFRIADRLAFLNDGRPLRLSSFGEAVFGFPSGTFDAVVQRAVLTGRSSNYEFRRPLLNEFRLTNFSGYVQDSWKLSAKLNVNLGLRYEYFTPVDERLGMAVLPDLPQGGGDLIPLLYNRNYSHNFFGAGTNRRLSRPDRNNYSPYLGFAYAAASNLVIRGAYSINYVNDNYVRSVSTVVRENLVRSSLSGALADGNVSRGPTNLRGYLGDLSLSGLFNDFQGFNQVTAIDPNLQVPSVQQWNFGVQYKMKDWLFDGRYVGNHLAKGLRTIDVNQVQLPAAFLDVFQRNRAIALSNNPNASLVPFPGIRNGGFIDTAGRVDLNAFQFLVNGEAGELAKYFQQQGRNTGNNIFMANPLAPDGIFLLSNLGRSRYDAFQFNVTRRTNIGLTLLANYTFSKVLSDLPDDTAQRVEPYLDLKNRRLDRARAPFDLTHAVKLSWIYDLPIGKGRLSMGRANAVFGGWTLSGISIIQSGAPFSVLSQLGTLASRDRSFQNPASSSLSRNELAPFFGLVLDGSGPRFVQTQRLATRDAFGFRLPATYNNFSPAPAGGVGNLGLRSFNGPSSFNLDLALQKTIKVSESNRLQLRVEAFNVMNNVSWFVGDQILGGSAGLELGRQDIRPLYQPRRLQFALRYSF